MKEDEQVYIRSMRKLLRVTAVFPIGKDGEVAANARMERTNDAVVAEFAGLIWLADKGDRGLEVSR
jgi:hypothetical protein